MIKKCLLLAIFCLYAMSIHAQDRFIIDDLSLDTAGWIIQDDIEGYHVVLNSSDGMFDFMFANQYVPDGEAVIAIADQAQFAINFDMTSTATDARTLAAEIETAYSYAVDMPLEVLDSGIYRLRMNFGTLKQYAYVTEFEDMLLIFYLFTSENAIPPSFEPALLDLISSVGSGDSVPMTTTAPPYVARAMSNGIWVIYDEADAWLPQMTPDYHQLRLEHEDEASGYLSLRFITPEHYGEAVFDQPDVAAILTTAKGYNPPYDPPQSTVDLPNGIEFIYPDRTYRYHLFEFGDDVLLIIANLENAYRDIQQPMIDRVFNQLNQTVLLDSSVQFDISTFETIAGVEMRSMEVGFTQYTPYATLTLSSENRAELFSIELTSGVESGTYDLQQDAIYFIEVMLEGDIFAYARYTANAQGTLTLESDGYTVSGTIDYTAGFDAFIDPYTGVVVEGETSEELPLNVTLQATFAHVEITGREYAR